MPDHALLTTLHRGAKEKTPQSCFRRARRELEEVFEVLSRSPPRDPQSNQRKRSPTPG